MLLWLLGQKFPNKTLEASLNATVFFGDRKQPTTADNEQTSFVEDPFCTGINSYAQVCNQENVLLEHRNLFRTPFDIKISNILGSRDGAVVIALASHHWMWPGFDSRTRCHKWVEFVVGSRPCSEGFSPGSPVFFPPQKSTFLNSNSIGNSRATGLSVVWLLCVTLVKTKLICLFI